MNSGLWHAKPVGRAFVRNLPLDLTTVGDPARSKAPDGLALRNIGPRKLHQRNKVSPSERLMHTCTCAHSHVHTHTRMLTHTHTSTHKHIKA